MRSLFPATFGLPRACLALLAAVVLGLAMFSAQPPLAQACSVLEPCDPPGPGGTLTSVSRVPAGVRFRGNLSIRTKVPATVWGYVTYGPVTSVPVSTRAFDFTIPARAGNQVCVGVDSGGQTGTIGCPMFNVTLNPFGVFEWAGSVPQFVDIRGWAIDPDSAAPISLQVSWDGAYVTNVVADKARADVGAANPGYGDAHGFDARVSLPSYAVGNHNLCVTGINLAGGANAQIGCITVVVPPPPLAPISFNAVSTAPNQMLVQWQYSGSDRPAFTIYRAPGPNGWYDRLADVVVTGPPPSVYNYSDSVSPDTQYCYKVKASTPYGESPQVGPVCAWTQLPAATNVHVAAATDTSLTIAWTDNATDETDNRVMFTDTKRTNSAGAHPGTGPTSYQLTGLQPSTQYCLQILTDGPTGHPSSTSAQACGTTTASSGSTGGVNQAVWWDCISGESLHLWTFDGTTGVWQDVTTLTPAFNGSGQCGPAVSTGYTLSLPDQHLMTMVAVDPQALTCGENNPQNRGCQRFIWQVLGNAQGAVIPVVVS